MKNLKIKPSLISMRELFDFEKIYTVPIYQRKYAWTKENIDTLIETLVKKYKYEGKNYVFLGNMEFRREEECLQIIDGQQRITTLLILLYQIAKERFDKNIITKLFEIEDSENTKKVNENSKFRNFLDRPEYTKEERKELERYKKKQLKDKKELEFRNENIYRLNNYYIEEALKREEIEDYSDFTNYILDNVYVVEILLDKEININEAIEIFNLINTTGKPLETKDIFKIRMYEYENSNEQIFNSINKLYNDIENENVKIAKAENEIKDEDGNKTEFSQINFITEMFNMDDILKIYKYILISRMVNENEENYKRELFRMSNSRFYDFLFKSLLNKVGNKKFDNFKKDCIKYKELIEIFDTYKLISDRVLKLKDINEETYFNYKMLKAYTRYSWMYNFLPVLYLWKFKDLKKEFDEFMANIVNLFEIYSIANLQVINSVKNFVEDEIIVKISNSRLNDANDANNINRTIINKITELKKNEAWKIDVINERLDGRIAENRTIANIACLILAKKAEDEINQEKVKLIKRYQQLFYRKFDIEHIYAKQNKEKELSEQEKENLDKLGNLMILEYSINRNIKNKPVEKKIEEYKKSKFAIVKKELKLYRKSFEKRQKEKVNVVKKYLKI